MLSLGFMPPVNQMVPIGTGRRVSSRGFRPTCCIAAKCDLVQLGLAVDPAIIFPPEYPYTSGTTKLLRDNFADLQREAATMLGLGKDDLVVDIGSNDGTLLSEFQDGGTPRTRHRADRRRRHRQRPRHPDAQALFRHRGRARGQARARHRRASSRRPTVSPISRTCTRSSTASSRCSTTTACSSPSRIISSALLDTLQYDTVYHEHLRYYSLASLKHLLEMHDLEVFHARPIPSHGGSIRVYAARARQRTRCRRASRACSRPSRAAKRMAKRLATFRRDVMLSKLRLLSMLRDLKEKGARVAGISAPSRAATLVNYVGLDEALIDYVCEVPGSLKIGKYMPGTQIPVVDEARLFDRPAGLRGDLLLAHRRRTRAQASGQGFPRQADHAAAGAEDA